MEKQSLGIKDIGDLLYSRTKVGFDDSKAPGYIWFFLGLLMIWVLYLYCVSNGMNRIIALAIVVVFSVVWIIKFKACRDSRKVETGINYYVGPLGFGWCDFRGSRDNITEQEFHKFDEFSELMVSEVEHSSGRGEYEQIWTSFTFRFWSKDGKRVTLIAETEEDQESPVVIFKNTETRFWKYVEKTWKEYNNKTTEP